MLKIKKNTSAYISLVLAVLALVVLIAIWATLPYIVDYFYSLFKGRVDGAQLLRRCMPHRCRWLWPIFSSFAAAVVRVAGLFARGGVQPARNILVLSF